MAHIKGPIPAGDYGRSLRHADSKSSHHVGGADRENGRADSEPDRLLYALRPVPDHGHATDHSNGGNILKRPTFPDVAGHPRFTGQGERQEPEQRKHDLAENFPRRSCDDGWRKFAVLPRLPPDSDSACGRNRPIPGHGWQ